ncbi:MAG: zinc dependent phospholipase C family protein [Deltaproteobacteria bacterium]|nr:zinc dependent phospholipase C family protein [Candidatus Zymogenaceae bacterium]
MKRIIVLAFIVAILTAPGVAGAWDNQFHIQMVKDAVALCPTELRIFLKDNINALLLGATDPDITISTPIGYAYGYRQHYYIPDGDKGDGPYEVKTLSLSVIDLLSADFPDTQLIARRMGMVSHFIADSLQPRRYIGLAPNYPKDFIAEAYRSKEVAYLPVIYNGYNPIYDFSGDLKTFAKSLWYQNPTDDQYYDMAVNYIVDVWVTIWEKSGKQSGEIIATGSMIRPEIVKEDAGPATVFSPSEVLDLKAFGETGSTTGTYDESTFDINKYGTENQPPGETGTEEAPLEKKSPEEIENATGTPPPTGTTNPPEDETETPPADETPFEEDETGSTP